MSIKLSLATFAIIEAAEIEVFFISFNNRFKFIIFIDGIYFHQLKSCEGFFLSFLIALFIASKLACKILILSISFFDAFAIAHVEFFFIYFDKISLFFFNIFRVF